MVDGGFPSARRRSKRRKPKRIYFKQQQQQQQQQQQKKNGRLTSRSGNKDDQSVPITRRGNRSHASSLIQPANKQKKTNIFFPIFALFLFEDQKAEGWWSSAVVVPGFYCVLNKINTREKKKMKKKKKKKKKKEKNTKKKRGEPTK